MLCVWLESVAIFSPTTALAGLYLNVFLGLRKRMDLRMLSQAGEEAWQVPAIKTKHLSLINKD